jgi:Cu+-exporting ATPase
MKQGVLEFKVEGMTCTNCARTVSRFLERKGMEEVQVNVTTHEVQLKNNTESVTFEEIKVGIGKLGFSVVEEGEDPVVEPWSLERKFLVCAILTLPLFLGHLLMMAGIHLPLLENPIFQFFVCLPVYVIGFLHFGMSAYHALRMSNTNMDVLIFVGSTAAFVYSLVGLYLGNPDYIFFETAATIITLVLLGNLMEKRAVDKTTAAIDDLRNLQSTEAIRVKSDGSTEKISIDKIKVGYILQINEGDAFPSDGIVYDGIGWANEAMLTGETELVEKTNASIVTGASVLSSGNLKMKVTATGKDTVLSKIIDLVKNAQLETPDIQRLADKISAIFVPVVLAIAVLAVVIGHFVFAVPFTQALMNGIAVLVISCPCAMGLATPAAIIVGVGRAAKSGILIKGSRTLEIFAGVKNVVFDKTGTLTEGKFSVSQFHLFDGIETTIQAAVKGLEGHSSHPVAKSLSGSFSGISASLFSDVKEQKGVKMSGKDEQGNTWEVGSKRILITEHKDLSHDIYVLKNSVLVAAIDLEDKMKAGVDTVTNYFKEIGIRSYLLSGDKEEKVAAVAQALQVDTHFSEQLPEEKYAIIEDLKSKELTAMVGDGINDAAALAKADVGVTFGSASDVAVSSAGVVLLSDDPEALVQAHKISRHTLLTIKQNLFWAFAYNFVAIPIAAMGFLNPMLGALFMAFSDVVVIGNSLRLRGKKLD